MRPCCKHKKVGKGKESQLQLCSQAEMGARIPFHKLRELLSTRQGSNISHSYPSGLGPASC